MSKGRLTRQELGWLLTQEAAGAAERLRVGVQVLKTNAPPAPEADTSQLGLDATLDALDDAMKMLSSLHNRPSSPRGRRGRIDVASMIWEVAPEARVSIEPGSGTEVFGEESELRRMLHVLVGHGTGAGSAVTIRREGDDVKVAVVLGPDSSATAEAERAWVARMATRYGGRYDLEGGAEVLSLPADGVSERNEREALRKELDEARKQGEAYARELAQVLAHDDGMRTPSTVPPPMHTPGLDRFSTIARFAGGIAAELRHVLSPAARQVPPARAADAAPQAVPVDTGERWDTIRRALSRSQDFVAALASVGDLDPAESASEIDLHEVVRQVTGALAGRADRSGVRFRVIGEGPIMARAAYRATVVLVRELLDQALLASPRDAEIVITLVGGPRGDPSTVASSITVDDAGTALPVASRRSFVALEIEPGTFGRTTSVPLYVANEIVAWQGGVLELADSPSGGLRVTVTFSGGR